MPQRVRFVLLGVGYMGRAAIHALDVLRSRPEVSAEFEIETWLVADPDKRVWAKTKEHVPGCMILDDSEKALALAIERAGQDRILTIIYDATSPLDRPGHFKAVFEARRSGLPIAFIAEKPIAVTPDDLELIAAYDEADDFFCEFIEIGNDAFVALKKYLHDNGLPIERIACWRANSSGIRKSLGDGRGGVVGGALLDKAAHDVAIVASLLRSEKAHVHDARVHHLVPYSPTGWYTIRDAVEYGDDPRQWHPVDVLWPADGTVSVKADWVPSWSRESVAATFVWGWHGVTGIEPELEIEEVLRSLKHDRPYKLQHVVDLVEEQSGHREVGVGLCGGDRVFIDDDVRLVIVWSGAHTIVCNLLGKHHEAAGARLERYVIDYVGGTANAVYDPFKDQPTRDLKRINRQDLAEIFLQVMGAEDDPSRTLDFARKRTEFVHRFVFEAQAKAVHHLASDLGDFASILKESITLVHSKLRKQDEVVRKGRGGAAPQSISPPRE